MKEFLPFSSRLSVEHRAESTINSGGHVSTENRSRSPSLNGRQKPGNHVLCSAPQVRFWIWSETHIRCSLCARVRYFAVVRDEKYSNLKAIHSLWNRFGLSFCHLRRKPIFALSFWITGLSYILKDRDGIRLGIKRGCLTGIPWTWMPINPFGCINERFK